MLCLNRELVYWQRMNSGGIRRTRGRAVITLCTSTSLAGMMGCLRSWSIWSKIKVMWDFRCDFEIFAFCVISFSYDFFLTKKTKHSSFSCKNINYIIKTILFFVLGVNSFLIFMAYKDKYQSSDTQVNKENNIYTTVQSMRLTKAAFIW